MKLAVPRITQMVECTAVNKANRDVTRSILVPGTHFVIWWEGWEAQGTLQEVLGAKFQLYDVAAKYNSHLILAFVAM